MDTFRKDSRSTSRLTLIIGLVLGTAAWAGAAKVLVIYGNSNGTVVEGSYSLGDAWVKNHLETNMHHQVRFLWDQTAKDQMLAAADTSNLVVVLESVTSAYLTDKLKTTATPILNCEAMIQDDLGMTATGTGGDPGPPSQFPYGVVDSADAIQIKDSSHPLAAGLQGQILVYSAKKEINWGKVAATAHVVASLVSDPTGSTIYVYEKGSKLFDGTTAVGMRIGFFVEDDNKTGTATLFTPEGVKLFEAAVNYGLGVPTTALGSGFGNPFPSQALVSVPEIRWSDALGRWAPQAAQATVRFRPAPAPK